MSLFYMEQKLYIRKKNLPAEIISTTFVWKKIVQQRSTIDDHTEEYTQVKSQTRSVNNDLKWKYSTNVISLHLRSTLTINFYRAQKNAHNI